MTKSPRRPAAGLPDKDTLLAFLREQGSAEKTDIARHFGLKGGDRRALREMIRELEAEGKLGKRGRKGFSEAGALPPVGVADVVERDVDGEFYVQLVEASSSRIISRRARRSPPLRPKWRAMSVFSADPASRRKARRVSLSGRPAAGRRGDFVIGILDNALLAGSEAKSCAACREGGRGLAFRREPPWSC